MDITKKMEMLDEALKRSSNADVQNLFLDIRTEYQRMRDENLALKDQIKDLEGELRVKGQMDFDGLVYWLKDGEKKLGPFCQLCFDKDDKYIRLQKTQQGDWKCYSCGKVYRIKPRRMPLTSYQTI